MNALILGLDISSTAIGYVLRGGTVHQRGVIRLDKDAPIGQRCVAARDAVEQILEQHAIDCLAIESPVARFAKAIIPQARMSGVILELAERRGILTCEVTPTAAKLALAGDGAATKREMLQAAAEHFGYHADALGYVEWRGEWWACWATVREYSEHEADALAVAISAATKVIVEAAA